MPPLLVGVILATAVEEIATMIEIAAVAAAVTVEAAGIDLGHALVTMTDADIKKLKYMIQVSRCDDGAICIWKSENRVKIDRV
mmetsp:Transcript_19346/g.27811  ORF Transcript_19346/g.27811 Transcript_19346/m.27811 type:complete len:83 (+) Transcript_19346:429-677(+)